MQNDDPTPDLATPLEFGQSQLVRIDTDPGYTVIEIRNDGGDYIFSPSALHKHARLLPSLKEGGVLCVGTGGTEPFNERYYKVTNGEFRPIEAAPVSLKKFTSWFRSLNVIVQISIGFVASVLGAAAYEFAFRALSG